MKRIVLLITLFSCFSCSSALLGQTSNEVPEWFKYDSSKPYDIFQAWRNLTNRDAAITLGADWTVLGGRLIDENRNPLGNTLVSMVVINMIRPVGTSFLTDQNGYFIVYNPYALEWRSPDERVVKIPGKPDETLVYGGIDFRVAIGYPQTSMAFNFALSVRDFSLCKTNLIYKRDDRAFYELTASHVGHFDEIAFNKFKASSLARLDNIQPHRDKASPEEHFNGPVTTYKLRLVSTTGAPIPMAIVKYSHLYQNIGNVRDVETDQNGECIIKEEFGVAGPPVGGSKRILTVDAPGFGVGPVTVTLKAEDTNIVRLSAPASVSGTIRDNHGNGVGYLRIAYKKECFLSGEENIIVRPDGSFSFDRIMPGEEFKIVTGAGFGPGPDLRLRIASDSYKLKPGQARNDIIMHYQIPSALRGIVVDEGDKPVQVGGGQVLGLVYSDHRGHENIWEIKSPDEFYVGTGGQWGPSDHRFGFAGLSSRPFRIRVNTGGFQPYLSEEIRLEPGELRFVKIVLKRKKNAIMSKT